ncbi:MAG TPA: chemotaxis response regulator protein-glutamate methylesterase [Campylobacterales bacterium]|nr:chemotaxis response regulator protein-glutamate methylesterase [Campylobacterales bacterium]
MAKKVLIVDDSALIRKQLGELLDRAGYDIGFAKNGKEAVEFVASVDFDVITMDINMPVMDGLSAVKEIMKINPTPIVMVSSLTQDEADITFEALDLGAVDYVPKPGTITLNVEQTKDEILEKIATACKIKKSRLTIRKQATKRKTDLKKSSISSKKELPKDTEKLVLIGASTGGPGLIEEIVTSLPVDYPYPVCIVQHMPETFTVNFAKRLNKNAQIEVVEAKSGEIVIPGKAIIGKGGKHLHFAKKASGALIVKLISNTMNRFFVPSVDEMFFSAAKVFDPRKIMAVELTGIGDDGADGMVELKKRGAFTVGESEESAVVYGMPKEAYERGGVVKQLPFPLIVKEILKYGEK